MQHTRERALKRDPWIQRPRPQPGARLRLFCLPHAGGGASSFRGWQEALPPEVEVCPVQLPGRESRMGEPPFDRMEPLIDALSGVVRGWSDLPFAVFGHSNGALIGFELARRLRREGVAGPVHLFASGWRGPDVPSGRPPVAGLPDAELIDDLRQLGGMPAAVVEHPELMQILLPTIRADAALTESYVFTEEEPLDVAITAYAGEGDDKATPGKMETWGRHTRGGFVLRVFPGDHFFIHGSRDAVLRALSADLRRVMAGQPVG